MCCKLNDLLINKQISRDVTLLTADECVKIHRQKTFIFVNEVREKCQDHDVFATFQYVENTVSAISKHHDFQFNLQLYRSGLFNVTTCTGCHTKNMTSNKSFVETISEPHGRLPM